MSDRSVSDLVFRDLEPEAAAGRSDDEREATLREELVKLRAEFDPPRPRVIPAARAAARAGELPR
jgi:hypothetical protein